MLAAHGVGAVLGRETGEKYVQEIIFLFVFVLKKIKIKFRMIKLCFYFFDCMNS